MGCNVVSVDYLNNPLPIFKETPDGGQLGCLYRSRAPEGAQQGKDAGTSKTCENSASEQNPTVQPDRRSDQKEPEEPSAWCPCQVVFCNPAQKSYWVWQVWRYDEGPEGEAGEPDQEGDGGGLHARGPDRQIHLPVHHEPEGADHVPGVRHILNVRRPVDEGAGRSGMGCRKGSLRKQLLELHPLGWAG